MRKIQEKLKNKFNETQIMFSDTLNVKLRYEQIIKNLMENETKKAKHRLTVVDVIKKTKPATQVVSN